MNHNNIPEQLENKHKDVQMSSNTDTGDSVDVTADTGASVNAPVLTGNIITGPVHISYILNPPIHNTPTRIKGSTEMDSKVDIHHYGNISLRLKNNLQEDYKRILVGNSQTGHRGHLKDICNLYVVENETGRTVSDHDVIEIESTNRFTANDTPIQCNDIFKDHMGRQNRKVLTMGIAGVGKTVSVNKFILDWAEGKENQDILFVFPLPFRRLNLIKKKYSLMELLNKYFFSCPEELSSLPEDDCKVMFIFDGLDECRFPLNYKEDDIFTDVHKKTTVSKIVTNLIKRYLVPSALIWITSRPAAAGLIPRDYIDQVTEVRGFNDEQKEQYFIENSSPEVAGNIIRHIRKSRSLYIMCHIPVFCWISLTVLEPLLAQESNDKTPTTLTEMYTNFLLSQKQQMKTKYHDGPEPKPKARSFDQILLKLGKLAFKQLEKDNLIFYKEDLEECGLDVSEGLFTQIFQTEKAVSEREVYSFIHLSVQEFLAALYVFFKYKYYGRNAFLQSERRKLTLKLSKTSLFDLHDAAVNKSLKSENGHLDLFLWFLLGLSLESNQSDLKELLPMLELKTENVKDTADYIRQMIDKEKSVEKSINLFYCLSELKEDFEEDIQKYLSSRNLSAQNLSSAQWSALEFVRQISEETQDKFELQKYRRSEEALRLPANQNTRRALVDHGGEIRMTAGPRKFAYDLTLDPNTANTRLILHEENRKVKHVKDHQLYPDHPERFADVPQVLCGERLTGRCYWEVKCSGWVNISVSYKEISRKGGSEDCKFGSNDKSWSLFCTDNRFTVHHNNNSSDLPAPSPRSDRVGVYVDVSAGTLSFYSVSDTHTLTHLHTFITTFIESLYAGFGVDYYSSVSLCDIKQPPVRNNSDTHTTRDA
ncbi:protein NLRC3-like [Ctenopharyngodon idella]|uniref:protein NLRC3-like n=1 Tax=Ctenopharyngodon idella TaxID=7959 RepID=UPI00223069F4|nr:protein NLRC3-like [Ctenopharyngodon idella]